MLPIIIGSIPKRSSSGFQTVPNKNFETPIFPIVGIPFAKRNRHIRITAIIDIQAHNVKIMRINTSLNFWSLVFIIRSRFVIIRQYSPRKGESAER